MYKIKYLETGHIFTLPENAAKELKTTFPNDYKILEIDGKKYKDTNKKKTGDTNSIRTKVVEE